VRVEEASVDNMVVVFMGFGPASGLQIDWHENVRISVAEEPVMDECKNSNINGLQREIFPSYLVPLLANTWSCKMLITILSTRSRPNLDIGMLLSCHLLVELLL
jgi:hypothetical protein